MYHNFFIHSSGFVFFFFCKCLLNLSQCCSCFIFYFYFFWPLCMWDLSSPTRDWTLTPALGGEGLTTGPPGKSPGLWFFGELICFTNCWEHSSEQAGWVEGDASFSGCHSHFWARWSYMFAPRKGSPCALDPPPIHLVAQRLFFPAAFP